MHNKIISLTREALIQENIALREQVRYLQAISSNSGDELRETTINLAVHEVELRAQNKELQEAMILAHNLQMKYFNLVESAPVGYLTINAASSSIEEANPAAKEILLGIRGNLNNISFLLYLNTENQMKYTNFVKEAIRIKTPQKFELEIKLNQGIKNVIVELRFDEIKNKLELCVIDISELKQSSIELQISREILRESEERYRTIFNNVHHIMLLIDPANDQILDANPAAELYYGYSKQELLNMKFSNINCLSEKTETQEVEKFSVEGTKHLTSRHKNKKGEVANVEVYCGPITLNTRPVLYAIVIDTTQRDRLEQVLKKAEKDAALSTLTGGIAHDFNNLLGIIMGHAEMLGIEAKGNQEVLKCLNEILDAGKRAKDIILGLTDMIKPSQDSVKLALSINILIKQVMKVLKTGDIKRIPMELLLQSKGLVLGNDNQLGRVFVNLIINAAHAMEQMASKKLQIKTENIAIESDSTPEIPDIKPGSYIKISIKDNGTGIPPDLRDRIFDPYFTTKEIGKGTGLGLSISAGIIKEHAGYIYVESEQGKGSTFNILLPSLELNNDK